ncbi:MAG: protein kinase family protein [Nanoarchaeota archaeon]|nr:protein kinase family protein [Nanoarchaeota archaeon]
MKEVFFPTPKSKHGRTYLFQSDNVLGEGVHCKAFEVYDISDPAEIKDLKLSEATVSLTPLVMKLSKSSSPNQRKARIQREMKLLKKFNHHLNFVQYVDHSLRLPSPYLVTEFVPHTLDDLLQQGKMDNEMIWDYLIQIGLVLETIEQRGIAHGDIKTSNLGYDPDSAKIKVFDFGLSLSYDHKCLMKLPQKREGIYYPPEFKVGFISPTSDTYMAGRALELMLTGYLTQGPDSVQEAIDNIELFHDLTLPDSFKNILQGMLDPNYEERPLPQELRVMVNRAWEEIGTENIFQSLQYGEVRIPTGMSWLLNLPKSKY